MTCSLLYVRCEVRVQTSYTGQAIMYILFYRPNDSRMLVALGECYEKLNQHIEAKKVSNIANVYVTHGDKLECSKAFQIVAIAELGLRWASIVGVKCLLSVSSILCVCFVKCSVTGGRTQWEMWKEWLYSNWQSKCLFF